MNGQKCLLNKLCHLQFSEPVAQLEHEKIYKSRENPQRLAGNVWSCSCSPLLEVYNNDVSECIGPELSETGVNRIDQQYRKEEGWVGTLAAVNSRGMSRLKERMPGRTW